MDREALCFIERSATSSYITTDGGSRRVGGHSTRGNIYNVEKKVYTKAMDEKEIKQTLATFGC
jgi:hypothetical protein